jgi:hypothetical protein
MNPFNFFPCDCCAYCGGDGSLGTWTLVNLMSLPSVVYYIYVELSPVFETRA